MRHMTRTRWCQRMKYESFWLTIRIHTACFLKSHGNGSYDSLSGIPPWRLTVSDFGNRAAATQALTPSRARVTGCQGGPAAGHAALRSRPRSNPGPGCQAGSGQSLAVRQRSSEPGRVSLAGPAAPGPAGLLFGSFQVPHPWSKTCKYPSKQ